jgi:hypothetical protein
MLRRRARAAAVVILSSTPTLLFGQTPPRRANWVDTITVDRLPTGSCHWSAAARRMRPGKPGTATTAGPPNDKTCTVLFSNYTTGNPTDLPRVDAFSAPEDYKSPLPVGAVVNFADTFTVARTRDGKCDWSRTPIRTGKPGSSSYLAERLVSKCWGVVRNVTFARTVDQVPLKADTVVFRGPSDDELLADMKATSELLRKAGVSETDVVRGSRGRTNAEIGVRLPKGEARYTFVKKDGVWFITHVDTVPGPKPR